MSRIQTIRSNIEAHMQQERDEYYKERNNKRNAKWNKYYTSKYWKDLMNELIKTKLQLIKVIEQDQRIQEIERILGLEDED